MRRAWTPDERLRLRAKWGANLPTWAIAVDLERTLKDVQTEVRALELPHRPHAEVERVGRGRKDAEAAAEVVPSLSMPIRTSRALAASIAQQLGLAWAGTRADLARLNHELQRIGRAPVWVPFRELRP